jgi:hypothetical protein
MRTVTRRALHGLSLAAAGLALAIVVKLSRNLSADPSVDEQRVRSGQWTDRHPVRGSTSNQRSVVIGVALALAACVLGYLGYRWTRSTAPPPSPVACLGHGSGRCSEEQSGVYLYVSDPATPIALAASYGQNIFGPPGIAESLQVGANVPPGRSVRWMIQLYGVTRLTPQTFGPSIGGQRRRINLYPGVSLLTIKHWTPNSGTSIQVLQGEIRGPARGYSLMKAEAQNSVGFELNGIQFVDGDTSGRIVTENEKYILGDLPYVFATGPNDVPGAPATAPGISDGDLLVSGDWFFPQHAFVHESYTAPLAAQVIYAEPQTSQTGRMDWQNTDYVSGRFALSRLAVQVNEQNHQFWAGIALGVGGAAAIAAIQAIAVLPLRRRRRATATVL